jgi:hypothetical protein
MTAPALTEAEKVAKITAFGFDKPEHEIVWEFDDGWLRSKLVCNDLDCQHRYVCSGYCELIFDIQKTETGYRHQVNYYEDDRPSNIWHEMRKVDYCNFVEFMDTADLLEENEERGTFEIGRTAVEPVWYGEDGVKWSRVGSKASTA